MKSFFIILVFLIILLPIEGTLAAQSYRDFREENLKRVRAIQSFFSPCQEGGYRDLVSKELDKVDWRNSLLDDDGVVESISEDLVDILFEKFEQQFPCDENTQFTLDIRSKQELRDMITLELEKNPEYQIDSESLERQEQADAAEKYPLYKEGEKVTISFQIGRTPARKYSGVYRNVSRFKIMIGTQYLSLSDLPESLQARFDAKLNARLRKEEINKHLLAQKKRIALQEAVDVRVKEMLSEQFYRNLPAGWVYADNVWRMPKDYFEENISTMLANIRQIIVKRRKDELERKRREMTIPIGRTTFHAVGDGESWSSSGGFEPVGGIFGPRH